MSARSRSRRRICRTRVIGQGKSRRLDGTLPSLRIGLRNIERPNRAYVELLTLLLGLLALYDGRISCEGEERRIEEAQDREEYHLESSV